MKGDFKMPKLKTNKAAKKREELVFSKIEQYNVETVICM